VKFIAITWILLYSSIGDACQEPIKILYGPLLSVSFYKEYIFQFNENIEVLTKCKVVSVLEPTHEGYVKSLVQGIAHMSFVPGHYELALNAVGYERLLRGADGSKILLIAKKDSIPNNNIEHLKGGNVLVPGLYSEAYLFLIDWLSEAKMLDEVDIDIGHSYDGIAMNLLRNNTSAGVLSTSIFNRMPKNIKDSFYVIKESKSVYALLMARKNLPKGLSSAIQESAPLIKLGVWYESRKKSVPSKNGNRFREQLKLLLVD